MNFNTSKLTLDKKITFLFVLFSLLLVIIFTFVAIYKNTGGYLYEAIDAFGKNRTRSQQITLLATQLSEGNESIRPSLLQAIDEHDTLVTLFLTGGKVPGTSLSLPKAKGEAQEHLKNILVQWIPFKSQALVALEEPLLVDSTVVETTSIPVTDSLGNISYTESSSESTVKVKNPKIQAALLYLGQNSPALLAANDGLVQHLIAESQQRKKNFNMALGILAAVGVALTTLMFFLSRKNIVFPLVQVKRIASKIADRDFSTKITYQGRDEVGEISKAINQMIDNLNNAADFVTNIGEGKLEARYLGLEENGQLEENSLAAALIKMQEKMKSVAKEDRERNWSTEGLAKFVDILRSNNDNVAELGDQIISNLVKYTQSNQGGIFILNDEDEQDPYVELVACYAYNRKKFLEKKIKIGEGLIGQTFIEKKTTYLVKVPQSYVSIRSGLGGCQPQNPAAGTIENE